MHSSLQLRVLFQHGMTLPLSATPHFTHEAQWTQSGSFLPLGCSTDGLSSVQNVVTFHFWGMSLPSGFTGGSRESKEGFSLVIGPICMGIMDEKWHEEGWPKIPQTCIDLSSNEKAKKKKILRKFQNKQLQYHQFPPSRFQYLSIFSHFANYPSVFLDFPDALTLATLVFGISLQFLFQCPSFL